MKPSHLERQEVIEYTASQASDETVTHAERLTSEQIGGTDHAVWDVHTDKGRWWVITGWTNLYSQEDFKSMDGVLTFHIGLMARVMARQAKQAPDCPDPMLEPTRRQWEQAAEAQDEADEAEAFQAVGMRCRETLVSFAHALASDDLVVDVTDRPKASDVVHWAELVANAVAGGSRNYELRSYLKSMAQQTWQYVNWLTHQKNATRLDGELAVELTAHFLSLFEQLIHRKELEAPDRCPECGSYRVRPHWIRDDDRGAVVHIVACEACEWGEEVESHTLHFPEYLGDPVDIPPVAGEHTLSSDLGPGVSQPLNRP